MNQEERMHLEYQLYIAGLCLPCIGFLLFWADSILPSALASILHIPCLLHVITGYYCPGCGGTRAAAVLLQGEFLKSFLYHPIVPYTAVLYLWFMISHTIEYSSRHKLQIGMHYRNGYLYFALVLVIINAAVKNIALAAFQIDFLKLLDNAKTLIYFF